MLCIRCKKTPAIEGAMFCKPCDEISAVEAERDLVVAVLRLLFDRAGPFLRPLMQIVIGPVAAPTQIKMPRQKLPELREAWHKAESTLELYRSYLGRAPLGGTKD
jgi:hypothetical protein